MADRSSDKSSEAAPGNPASGLSIVVPAYNEAPGLPHLHNRIVTVARRLKADRGLAIEIVYVDDGSSDGTGQIAAGLPADVVDVQAITLSRNFGKEAALLAGLDHARLGAILFIDGDGQHPPELIDTLVARWLDDGNDVVYTAKAHRENESWARRKLVHAFYWLINLGAHQRIPEDAGDFRLLSPRAVAALRQMPERTRFFKGLASWIGYRQVRVDYEPAPRAHGQTSWDLRGLVGLSIDGLTSFSVAPLRVASVLGFAFAIVALLFGVQILIETLLFGGDVAGYPSLIVSAMVIGSVQLIMIGVLGEYIGKVLAELKARPNYFIADHRLNKASAGGKPKAPARGKT